MKINQFASKKNLELAGRRITIGGNYQYNRLYRSVYNAYEVALIFERSTNPFLLWC